MGPRVHCAREEQRAPIQPSKYLCSGKKTNKPTKPKRTNKTQTKPKAATLFCHSTGQTQPLCATTTLIAKADYRSRAAGLAPGALRCCQSLLVLAAAFSRARHVWGEGRWDADVGGFPSSSNYPLLPEDPTLECCLGSGREKDPSTGPGKLSSSSALFLHRNW